MRPRASLLLVAACLGMSLALPLSACGSRASSSSAESADASTSTEQAQDASTERAQDASTATAAPAESPYAVTIDGAQLTQDYDGNPAVIITYTFTNNSDEATSFATACYPKVFQNGVQCDPAFVTSGLEAGNSMQEIKAGATNQVQSAYELSDLSPIEVEVEEFMSFDDTIIAQKTFTLE